MNVIRFRRDHVGPILQGVKTETRRFWESDRFQAGDVVEAWYDEPGTDRECTFCWGSLRDTVAEVEGRVPGVCPDCKGTGRVACRPFATLRITKVYRQKVFAFDAAAARAEGYFEVFDLWDALLRCYGEIDFDREAVVLRFEVVR